MVQGNNLNVALSKLENMDKPDFTITNVDLEVSSPYMKPYFVLKWQTKSAGFGEAIFWKDKCKWKCENECMDKEFLLSLFKYIVDNCELVD